MFTQPGHKPSDSSVHSSIAHAITKVGCLSHPNAKEWLMAQWLMAPVIKELERRMKVCAKHSAFDKENIYEQAIALIRDGVK